MEISFAPELVQKLNQLASQTGKKADQIVQELVATHRRGRPGRVEGTRELVLAPLPFIVVYRIKRNIVEAVRVLHGSQRWP
jgi:toxin ParE1/3/4